jgi:glucokinase
VSEKVYIGLDVGGTNLKLSLVSRGGEILARGTHPSPDGAPVEIPRAIGEAIQTLSKGIPLAGIGIGCAGILSSDRRTVQSSPNLPKIQGIPVCDFLEGEFGVPTVLENDANAAALGEFWLGAGVEVETLIVLTMGTGLGTGFILNGVPWRGARGLSAEGGHTTIDHQGPPCRCGNNGCLEAFVGAYGILRRMRDKLAAGRQSRLRPDQTVEDISEAAQEGDALAAELLEETGRYLGVGLANFANLFEPEMIVVTGGVSRAGKIILDPAEAEMRRRAFPAVTESLRVVPGQLGDDAGPLGAVHPLIQKGD